VIPQTAMIDRVRQLCSDDDRVVAALTYGSFARGEGDAYSDIEFVLFIADDALPDFDREAWVRRISPVEVFFPDDFGHFTAIFSNLVRGEIHFDPYSQVAKVETWRGYAYLPSADRCILKDRDGELARRLSPLATQPPRDDPERVASLEMNLANAVLFGSSVLDRGEAARALELLSLVHRYLLWLARRVEGNTDHWPTPSRMVEKELPPAAYARFGECTAALDRRSLERAYYASWVWGQELMAALEPRFGIAVPASLRTSLAERIRHYA
jgi:lincosamide nucleotidyltransferase